ncbi:Putative hemolysin [Roseobacter sp. SK209-2-6]|nr:Putative hemolysin [Roseobacter sp. SK209-2-6]
MWARELRRCGAIGKRILMAEGTLQEKMPSPRGLPSGEVLLVKAGFRVRLAGSETDLLHASELRARCFGREKADQDLFDRFCFHILVEREVDGRILGVFRLRHLTSQQEMARCYTAQSYGLGPALQRLKPGSSIGELGRFCIDPDVSGADVARLAWAGLTVMVERLEIKMLIGCSSFQGNDPSLYLHAFALLQARYLAPSDWQPGAKAAEYITFIDLLSDRDQARDLDLSQALRQMPPLLRNYLTLGGCVSDHLVQDRDLGTMHVFTALDIEAIPEKRKAGFRALLR